MRTSAWLILPLASMTLAACADTTSRNRYGYNDRYPTANEGYRDRDGRYYRNGRYSRQLGDNDVIYRDENGRYYCKKEDGTTGTIVGAIAGGVLGNVVAPGGSKTLGTIIGAAGGALAGRAIDKSDARCE